MMRHRLLPLATLAVLLFTACSTQQNTWLSRHYQELNTRFNVHFNGEQAYIQGVNQLNAGFTEDFSKVLPMYQVSNHNSAKGTSSSMDRAIEKCQKAIKAHSIRVKPKKKPGPKASVEAKRYFSQEEFNPFMDDVFMLMANAQFTKADFLSASATCSYIIRHFATNKKRCDEAGILQARAYTELEWYYEAENLLNDLNKDNLTPSLTAEFAAATADLFLRRKKYAEALPYLEIASRKIHNKREKQRWSYLLGQLYQATDKRDKAYQIYSSIPAMNPPYEMELSARIRQSEVFPSTDPKKPLKKLVRLSKSSKNTEYLDQVYYAMGNLYLTAKDTIKALESFNLSLLKSVKSGPHKLKTLLTLGDFHYRNERFIEAEPCYTDAMGMLSKEDERYLEASLRSTILKELAPPLKTVFLEDSLQLVAKMPEKERLDLISSLMKAAEKKAKEAARLKAAQETAAANENERAENAGPDNTTDPVMADINTDKNWYFYNRSTVEKGMKDFRKKWGKRALNDDWRRNRKTPLFENQTAVQTNDTATAQPEKAVSEKAIATDSVPDLNEGADDPTKLNFYLKDLPFTEEQLAASGSKIAEGLYQSGLAFREQLENDRLALQQFDRLENEYPQSEHLENAWYIKYLIYKQEKQEIPADSARIKLLRTFPNRPWSIRLKNPDYIEKLIEMHQIQDTLYANTYGDYLKQRSDSLFNRSEYVLSNYPSSELLPKFTFLQAMEYARTGRPEDFHHKLTLIRDSFPASAYLKELEPVVKGMLAFWDAGRRPIPSAGYTNLLSLQDVQSMDSLALLDSLSKSFIFKPEEPHFILMVYDSADIRINRLQFDVALYDFTNFLVRDYDLQVTEIGKMDVLLVSGFENALDAVRYRSWIQFQGQKPEEKYKGLRLIIVSESNLKLLEEGVSTEKYELFFNATYSDIKLNP